METALPYFDEAYEAVKIRGVGLSNFTPELVDEAHQILKAPIHAIQVEIHLFFQQEELVEYASEHDMGTAHWRREGLRDAGHPGHCCRI